MRLRSCLLLLLLMGFNPLSAAETLFRHPVDAYDPLTLTWQAIPGVGPRTGLYAHHFLSEVVALIGPQGLTLSKDGGRSWIKPKGLPTSGILNISFHPSNAEKSLVASTDGLWGSDDGGVSYTLKPWSQLAEPIGVWYHPRDPLGRIIVVAHGDHALGLSVSSDSGDHWRSILPEYHVHNFYPYDVGDKPTAVLVSLDSDPYTRSFVLLATLDERPVVLSRDCEIVQGAMPFFEKKLYVASPRNGLLRIVEPSNGFGEIVPIETGAPVDNGYSGLAFCWGPNVDREYLFVFDPFELGLRYRDGDTWNSVSTGLPIGPMVKEGACFTTNANGSRFFAIINDQAFLGLPVDRRMDGLQVKAEPAVALIEVATYGQSVNRLIEGFREINKGDDILTVARGLEKDLNDLNQAVNPNIIHLQAKILEGSAPTAVTVDLSRFGEGSDAPLFDDGAHGDGAAGDGLWARDVRIRPNVLTAPKNDWRQTPGKLGLSVSAHWKDGRRSGAVAPLLVCKMVERKSLADRLGSPEKRLTVDGAELSMEYSGNRYRDSEIKLVAKGGPWSMKVGFNYTFGRTLDMGPFEKCGFQWMGELPKLHLLDNPMFDTSRTSAEVSVDANMVDYANDDGWIPVRVNIDDLVPDNDSFSRNHMIAWVFSGNAAAGEIMQFRSPCLLPEGEK